MFSFHLISSDAVDDVFEKREIFQILFEATLNFRKNIRESVAEKSLKKRYLYFLPVAGRSTTRSSRSWRTRGGCLTRPG